LGDLGTLWEEEETRRTEEKKAYKPDR
jgi:hypothetical protein